MVFKHCICVLFITSLLGCATVTETQQGDLARIITSVDASSLSPPNFGSHQMLIYPSPLEPYVNKNRLTGQRGQVLDAMESSVVAFDIGAYNYSKALLNEAYNKIETVYAGNAGAKAARSKFVPEANKDFKGEPYERSMVGYYLGLSEMLIGQLDDAGVSFRWGELQDTMSASENYQSDFALLNFMDGWVKKCQGDIHGANESFKYAEIYQPQLTTPSEDDNLLIIAESGFAPKKVASGQYSELLSYQKGLKGPDNISVSYGFMNKIPLVEALDVFYQASTLGGREVDKILAGKAQFKGNAETTADAAAATAVVAANVAQASYFSGDNDTAQAATAVAGAALLLSIAAQVAAEAATPRADVRAWSNLPGKVHIATLPYKKDKNQVEIQYKTGKKKFISDVDIKPTGSCYIAWDRGSSELDWDSNSVGAWVAISDNQGDLNLGTRVRGNNTENMTEKHKVQNEKIRVNEQKTKRRINPTF